ncbi:hypothetical protein N9726_00565 [Flavobacteriaceae bacterium]|jgi:hypothetical protein|nr:hypothetical protein [Flavobacteriaceae bacterium]|tara:strand:+ start:318 stop:791 length:474 start_codon:yes stop_codon:yes gene_type:complete
MKNILFFFTFLFTLCLFSQEESKIENKEKHEKYIELLKSEGFRPETSASGNVTFKYEGDSFYIETYLFKNDYLQVYRLFNWEKGCGYNLLSAINATNQYNFSPSVKTNDDCSFITVSYGNYLQNENEFDKVLFSSIDHIKSTGKLLLTELKNVGLLD